MSHILRRGMLAVLLLLSSCLTALAVPGAASAQGGTFDALTYNVAGLPEILSSAATDRTTSHTAIGQRLGPYEIVNVQEDFNYHAALYAADTHPYRTATTGGAGIGSGLNTVSSYAFDELSRTKWADCALGSGDCLTPKGFTFLRVRLAEGVFVDVYNLHTDAGSESADITARAKNLAQVTSYIQTHSAGKAVIVMGDTNTRYTRTGDTIAAFAATNGLTDAWVQLERGGVPPVAGAAALLCDDAAPADSCETVDKILYRGDGAVSLTATDYRNDSALFREAGTGLMLSDHHPIATTFSWTTNPAVQQSDLYGGTGGTPFTDVPSLTAGASPTTFTLRGGSRLDQAAVTLSGGITLAHGGTGGTAQSLTLGAGEHVASAKICQGTYSGGVRVFSVTLTTSLGRTLTGGTATSDCVTRTAPSGWRVAGFHGRAGSAVDRLGVVYTPR
ncbi:endonuclease/exonuclease/phosphatase family metal-dependent hydrolase [Actinocorallia herbida]|uniref:Endonuclease/exonuclease/phosphatase family metal-dependent hydrolase n=1 Tax=Actinocorallia herbida TaxID=58109 RepID=A0A3N1CSI3_9ACTN|nr:jacalin-like lectin [Actinocorallia herbida]ROO84281.1 endonuclease/exonuclease/phosphatase family metal-dependent hydrolase [Actinocorallia herbida]